MKRLSERLSLEQLEDRTLLSTCHVTRMSDTGMGKGFRGDLRYCINKVNANPGADIIDFRVTGTINLTSVLPHLSSDMEIQGPGADLLTVRRMSGGLYRIFDVNFGAQVEIQGLTIANGWATTGGGIYNVGTLTIIDSTITGNTASGTDGFASGGGIDNGGDLTLIGSTVSDNTAYADDPVSGCGGSGDALATGGGISSSTSPFGGSLTIDNSTIVDNIAFATPHGFAAGGAIFSDGPLTITHSTIASNVADVFCDGIETGGGISKQSGALNMRNTIVAGNTAPMGADLSGSLTSSGYNLFGNAIGGDGYASTDLLNVDPQLGPLADNGGPTQTMALQPGSPAIDIGDNTDAPDWDQRGEGFPRVVGGTIDIGAFEVQTTGAPGTNHQLPVLITADFDSIFK